MVSYRMEMTESNRYNTSDNPVLSRYAKVDADKDFSTILAAGGVKVTLNDVIIKTAIVFVLTVGAAVVGWNLAANAPIIWIVAAFIALGLGFANAMMRTVQPLLVMAYAAAEGVMLGGISHWYDAYAQASKYQGIVLQAVLGTLTAFAVMLVVYNTDLIKVNGRFLKVMVVSFISYFAIGIASVIAALFGVGGGWGFYGVSGWGLLLMLAGVLLASLTLLLDFEAIKQGIAAGAPERESWRMAFGLLVTLVWLYLEILRLLAIVNGRR